MNLRELRILGGPNVWAACPVLELVLDCGADGAALAEALVARVRELQRLAGTPVEFLATRRTGAGVVLTAVEFAEEAVGRAALEIARRLLPEADGPTAEDVQRLRDLRPWIPPTVATTYYGAKKRGVPVTRLSAEYSGYLVLGHGSQQRRVRWSEPDAVSGVARLASTDKYLTKQLLESVGVPVPRGRMPDRVEDAWAAAVAVGLPVAVKPYNCDLQTGVALDLRTREQVEAAFLAALEHSSGVLVEHFAPGVEHRVLVVGERVVAVTRIDPPQVVGDGVSTIRQLVGIKNDDPHRGDEESDAPLYRLKLDEVAEAVLASQGYALDSVPPAGVAVLVRRDPPYFKNGGSLTDLTDQIHPSTAAHAVAAAAMMQVPVAGLDVVAVDIGRPLEEQEGVIVEINANPGFWLHLAPWADSPRPVGEEVAAWLFPDGNDGRIPVVAVADDSGGAVLRHLTALLSAGGTRVGTAGPREMSAGGRRWPTRAGTPQERAYLLFRNPAVDVALFETSGEELRRHGFASDRCGVAVVLGPAPAATDGERDPAEFVRALANALSPEGHFVVTADWPAERMGVATSRVILVASPDDADALDRHLASGGRAVYERGSDVVLGDGTRPGVILGPAPAGEIRPILAAVAAAWSLGRNAGTTDDYLRSLA